MLHTLTRKRTVNQDEFKIGFSDIGGIYIGKNIQSDFSKHYAITVLISFGGAFKITTQNKKQDFYKAAILQKNVSYTLETNSNDYVAFLHIVPYSENGQKLSNKNNDLVRLEIKQFASVISELKEWFKETSKDISKVEYLLNLISSVPKTSNNEQSLTDERVKKSFPLIMHNENEKLTLNSIASQVHLSSSHFARLFKKETNMTFRQFYLHSKLIRSIFAMYQNNNLTEAAFIGGFSDQPHFTRTFNANFGIKPSKTLK